MWWHTFAVEWNGISFLSPPSRLPQLQLMSDASGLWGCGAWHGRKWFQLQWDQRSAVLPIMVKELLPIVLACAVWGHVWGSHRVVCQCDNQAVVASLRSRTSRESHIMHMLRTLAFIEARHTFSLLPQKRTTWQTIYGEICSLPFFSRSPKPTRCQHLCRGIYWTYSWTKPSIGPLLAGSICSALLSGRTCTVHEAVLRFRKEKIQHLL